MSTGRKGLKVSGLLQTGKIEIVPTIVENTEFGAPTFESNNTDIVPLNDIKAEWELVEKASHRGIRLDLIDDSPYQPRELYDLEEIDQLGHSMASSGQDEQITVRLMTNGRYELIKGHRRTRAARSLGWTQIEADIVIKSDREAKLSAMISNEGRVDLSDYERGKLYSAAQQSGYAKTQDELAHLFGTTQERVSQRMAMLNLPKAVVEMLENNPRLFGTKTGQDIRLLLKEYPKSENMIVAAARRIIDGANESSVKAWVQQMMKPKVVPNEAVVTNKAGRTIFKAKLVGREFTIQIKDELVDANEIKEMVLTALRQRAEQAINETP